MNDIDYNVKKINLYEIIADKLEEMILSDSSQLGQKLPSEQSLATSFKVSRNVIRESLKLLKERHLITLRTGEGTYIAKPKAKNFTDILNRMILMDNIQYSNVFEMRMLLEPYACRLAAEKGTQSDFDELDINIEHMIQSKDNTDERIKYDLKFHFRIAELSGNPILACFVQSMAKLLEPLLRKALVPSGGHQSGIEYHKRLVVILRSGDGNLAEQVMKEHLEVSTQNYLQSEQNRDN